MAAVAAAVATASGADTANHVESAWSKLNGPLLDAATEVCGISKNHQWKPKSWWWNEEVYKAIQEKHARFKVYSALKKGSMTAEAKKAKTANNDAKRMAKHAIWLLKSEAEKEEFPMVSPDGDGVFRITKQMDCRNQDIVAENCVCNDASELALTDEDKMKALVEHYDRLLNVESEWPSNELPGVPPAVGPLPVFSWPWSAKHSTKWNEARLLAHMAL